MRRFAKILSVTIIAVFLFGVISWTFLYFTGHHKRSYSVLNPEEQVKIKQETMSVAELAAIYQPALFATENTASSSPPLHMWYEVIDSEQNTLILVYHPSWVNETHPNPVADMLYAAFRSAYYGSVYDIEFIQIEVSTNTGIIQIRYETSNNSNYYNEVNEHFVVSAEYLENASYLLTVKHKSGGQIYNEIMHPLFVDGNRPAFGDLTWNHLLVLREQKDNNYIRPISMDLVYLTEEDYKRYQMARRSQGDYAVPLNNNWVWVSILGIGILFVVITALTIRALSRREKVQVAPYLTVERSNRPT